LTDGNVAIVGLPGVGKSALVRSIAAKYNEQNKGSLGRCGIVLSLGQHVDKPQAGLELMEIDDNVIIGIPIISVPTRPTESLDILKSVLKGLDNLAKQIDNFKNLLEKARMIDEDTAKIRDALFDILKTSQSIPTEYASVLEVACFLNFVLFLRRLLLLP
jgi:ABC-type phosphate/phosphonate transport system ATPase subunit